MFLVGTVQLTAETRERHARLVREALRLADISPEKAALYMSIDRAQFDRQLKGEGHISHTRLMALPEEFWKWLYWVGASELGMPETVLRGMKLALALKDREQVRMDLPDESAARRTA